jgi:hypothetical protein
LSVQCMTRVPCRASKASHGLNSAFEIATNRAFEHLLVSRPHTAARQRRMSPQKKKHPNRTARTVCRENADAAETPEATSSGLDCEWDDLKRLTRQQLEFAGWIDEIERHCRRIAAEATEAAEAAGTTDPEGPAVRHAALLDGVRDDALRSVPDHIKARVLKDIKDKLLLMASSPGERR